MIYVKDKGRLCNNILQFGHAYAWAREHGLTAVSMRFAYKYRGFRICRTKGHSPLRYLWAKYGSAVGLLPEVRFDSRGITPARESELYAKVEKNSRRGVVLSGWWVRNYDLFLKYRSEICDLFSQEHAPGEAPQLPPAEEGSVWLGVHVRRGDYIRWNGGRYFYKDEVYIGLINRFIELMAREGKRVNVALFTNDPGINRRRYASGISPDAGKVIFPFGSPQADLELMSLCDYIIGAPSTFSLTAAMFHDRPLYFIEDSDKELTLDDFSDFATLFHYDY